MSRSGNGGSQFPTDYRITELQAMSMVDLVQLARSEGIESVVPDDKQALVHQLLDQRAKLESFGWAEGILQVLPEGFGFLRSPLHGYRSGADDVYVAPSQIDRLQLRNGEKLWGPTRPPRGENSFFALARVAKIDDLSMRDHFDRVPFRSRVPVLPHRRLVQRGLPESTQGELLELWTPLCHGQQVLVRSPAGSRRTEFLAQLGSDLLATHADLHLVMMMIDEPAADATVLRTRVPAAEVVHIGLDDPRALPGEILQLVLDRCQRLVECGQDVVLLVNSLTRLVQANSLALPHSGKVLGAGVDTSGLQGPRKLLGSARQCEGGAALTVMGTLLESGAGAPETIEDLIAAQFLGRAGVEIQLGADGLDLAACRLRPEEDPRPAAERSRLERLRSQLPTDPGQALEQIRR